MASSSTRVAEASVAGSSGSVTFAATRPLASGSRTTARMIPSALGARRRRRQRVSAGLCREISSDALPDGRRHGRASSFRIRASSQPPPTIRSRTPPADADADAFERRQQQQQQQQQQQEQQRRAAANFFTHERTQQLEKHHQQQKNDNIEHQHQAATNIKQQEQQQKNQQQTKRSGTVGTEGPDAQEGEQLPWWKAAGGAWEDVSTQDALTDAIASPGKDVLVVDWFASWCHGCRMSAPALEALATDPELAPRVRFVRAAADGMRKFARAEGARALPFISIYKDGVRVAGFGAGKSKRKTWKPNIKSVLDGPTGAKFAVDPNGFLISVKDEGAEDKKRAEMEELLSFRSQLAGRIQPGDETALKAEPVWRRGGVGNGVGGGADSQAKREFMRRNASEYGYGGRLDATYQAEVGCRMAPGGHYMDYAGSSVYCLSQLRAVFDELQGNMFGNPHSANPSSSLTQERIEEAREMVLAFFAADPAKYQVVFTKSATAALKTVGETFPWSDRSMFRYLRENHNSVLGIREYALNGGGTFQSVDEKFMEEWLGGDGASGPDHDSSDEDCTYNLFAFPAEDNFAGVKYPLRWVNRVQQMSRPGVAWKVALDAAAYVPSQPLNLSEVSPDFVAISFYKMFGFPTGLGALIIRVDAVDILNKRFWAGGSVALSTSKDNFHVLKCRPSDRLEDGTVAFLDIIALKHGFNLIKKLGGIKRIQAHVACVTEWLYDKLHSLKHSNSKPIVKIFGKHDYPNHREVQGGILNFEVLKPDGSVFSYKTFEREAASKGFHIRTGVECNPGAAYNYMGVEESEIEELAGTKDGCDDNIEFLAVQRPENPMSSFDSEDVLGALKGSDVVLGHPGEVAMKWVQVPLGSVRVSLGYMTTFEDCAELVSFIERKYKDRVD